MVHDHVTTVWLVISVGFWILCTLLIHEKLLNFSYITVLPHMRMLAHTRMGHSTIPYAYAWDYDEQSHVYMSMDSSN